MLQGVSYLSFRIERTAEFWITSNLLILFNRNLHFPLEKPVILDKITTLNDLAKVSMVHIRFKQLSLRYIQNALINKNPIILGSFDEYLRFASTRNLSLKTKSTSSVIN
ncbi:hypothetical protein BpHYR1_041867 [Brachionus plicatilis]|uniref:Uncharacterized protein n=1 Tax=Brachionus plicatilis TaxID=10195 RepID=A0A3M7QG60_BRAPC|nr:hypothetical protein BpHYR1_041867 [Brachionus plicatilis]